MIIMHAHLQTDRHTNIDYEQKKKEREREKGKDQCRVTDVFYASEKKK